LGGGLEVNLGGGVAIALGGRLGFALGGGDAVSGVLIESRLRDGNGGAGLGPVPDLPLEGTSSASVGVVGVGGPLSRSSDLAPGIFPTLFGGGAKVLTSLTAMVAKCRPPTSFSSSFFPLKGTIISPFTVDTTFVSSTIDFAFLTRGKFVCFTLESIQTFHGGLAMKRRAGTWKLIGADVDPMP
jgi:hypothetical protein